MVRKAMAWASRQPNVEIVNIGLDPPAGTSSGRYGWRDDFKEHRAILATLDVGISPLVGTPMTKFRSDLKALEYAMGGAMPILQAASRTTSGDDTEFARMCWTPTTGWTPSSGREEPRRGARSSAAGARVRARRAHVQDRDAIGGR
jgi:hypothetical protein